MAYTYSRKQALSLSALNPSKRTKSLLKPRVTKTTKTRSSLKKKPKEPVTLTTGDEIVLKQGEKEYTGKIHDDIKVTAVRTVPKEEQEARSRSRAYERAIIEARQNLMVEKPKEDDKFTFSVEPGHKLDNLWKKQVFTGAGLLATSTGVTMKQRVQPKYVATVETEHKVLGLTIGKSKRQAVTSLERPAKPMGEVRAFIPERDLQTPTTFFGIKEPGFKKLRILEYKIEQKAVTEDIKTIRDHSRDTTLSGQASFFHGVNIPIKALNRPITTTVVVGSMVLLRGFGGGTGSLFTTTEVGLGLTAGATAVMRQQEAKAGGTGSRTLGFLGFTATAGLVSYGVSKGVANLKKTDIEYKIMSRGTEAKDFTGVTKKGSVLQGRSYKEAFYTKGDVTHRTIHLPKGKLAQSRFFGKFKTFQEKPTLMKITETRYFQAIKYYRGSKLLGEGFQYIKPTQTIQGSVIPRVTGRKILFMDQTESKFYSKLKFEETTSGSISKETQIGTYKTKVDLKVAELFRRNVVATDQLIRVQSKGLRIFEKIKPEFAFGKKASYPKDQVILQEVGFGKNKVFQRVDIVAPRIIEVTKYHRTAVGTVTIKSEPILSRLKILSFGKSGSLKTGTITRLQPVIKISPKTSPSLSLNLPRISTSSKSSVLPLFSIDTKPSIKTISKVKQLQRPEAKIEPINLDKVGLKTVSKPKADVGDITKPLVYQDTQVGLKTGQKQTTVTTTQPQVGLDVPYSTSFGLPGTPGVPGGIVPPPIIPKLPKFTLMPYKKIGVKSGKPVKSKAKYRPSLEAIAFNIKGMIPEKITPFSLRPIPKRKTKKRKKR